jgi:putative ABC transport system permease protein
VILKLVWENVRFRPLRTLLSMLLIAFSATSILTLVGMTNGFLDNARKRNEGVGADLIFRAKGSSVLSSANGAPMSEKFIQKLEKEPHVVAATGVVYQQIGGAGFDSVNGIDQASFNRVSGGFVFLEGHPLEKPDDILLDQYFARQSKVHAGGTIKVLKQDWHVAGIVEPGKLAHLFVQIGVLQDLIGSAGRVSTIYLKLDNPANAELVKKQLEQKYEDYPIYSMKDIEALYSVDNVPLLKYFTDTVLVSSVLFGFIVVALSMYMAVLQRTREIGILKSLGASKSFVMTIILAEAGALGVGGTLMGIILSFGTRWLLNTLTPASFPQAIVVGWWPIAGAIATGGALLGAIFPGLLAVRQDPIEALAYE